jgi:hypothetical protein
LKRKSCVLFLIVGFCILFAEIVVLSACNGGMTIGLMGNAEQVSIVNVRFVEGDPAGNTIKLRVQNSGSSTVAITNSYTNGTKATNISPGQAFIIPKGNSQELTLTFPNNTLVYGAYYQVKLVTSKGTMTISSLTYDSASTSEYDPFKDGVDPTPSTYIANANEAPSNHSPEQAKVLFTTLVLAVIAHVGACLLANYAIQPRNRGEFLFLLFFVTFIVGGATIALVSNILFPPMTIG